MDCVQTTMGLLPVTYAVFLNRFGKMSDECLRCLCYPFADVSVSDIYVMEKLVALTWDVTVANQILFQRQVFIESYSCLYCSFSCPFPNSLGVAAACLLPPFSSITRHFITHSHLSHILPHTVNPSFLGRPLPLHPSTFMFITFLVI
jgi:hypothetical protein